MKKRTKQWLAAALSAQTIAAGPALRARAEPAPNPTAEVVKRTANRPVSVKPGTLKGTILDPATNKPWSRVSVELVDPQTGKVLKKTRADKKGRYDLGKLDPGRYVVRINGRIELPLDVAPSASVSALDIAVPKALMGKVVGAMAWTTIGLIGTGVATAVAVPVALSSSGDGDSDDPAEALSPS